MTARSKNALALFLPATLFAATVLLPVDLLAAGRYKKGPGGGCYWDANDTGPNQCTPPKKGRYKKDGDKCEWDPNDTGPNQCTPPKKS